MAKEQSPRIPLTAIHINLEERAIELEDLHGTVARVDFSGETILFNGQATAVTRPLDFVPELTSAATTGGGASEAAPARPPAPQAAVAAEESSSEKESTVSLTGRLKSTPKEGRADRSGNPTAWARFAAHIEGEDEPHLFLTTFHRHTARIALGLKAGSQLTVEGYPHVSDDPKRLDTFSVVNIVSYPGKPAKAER